MDKLQAILSWLQANASWLQVAAAIAQAFAAVAAIPIAVLAANRGAERGARRAFELSEEKEAMKLGEQILLVRFLLGLELQSNFDDLKRFYNNLLISPQDDESSNAPQGILGEHIEAAARRGAPCSIVLYMPDLSYRFWHNQQLSPLLPLALDKTELHKVSNFYSSFDRLLKIKNMIAAHVGDQSEARIRPSGEQTVGQSTLTISSRELTDLSIEFDSIIQDIIEMDNPLKDALEEKAAVKSASKAKGSFPAKLKS
jgi:hypothetical protein